MVRTIRGALSRRFGPLPAWGWLAIFAGAVYLYRHHRASGAMGATAAQVPVVGPSMLPAASTAAAAGVGGADLGAPPPAEPAQPGSGYGAPLVYDPTTDSYSPVSPSAPGPGSTPVAAPTPSTPIPVAPAPAPAAAMTVTRPRRATAAQAFVPGQPHPGLPQPSRFMPADARMGGRQPLYWDGRMFTTKDAFNHWAQTRGISLASYFQRYPQAGQLYKQLPGNTGPSLQTPAPVPTMTTQRQTRAPTPAASTTVAKSRPPAAVTAKTTLPQTRAPKVNARAQTNAIRKQVNAAPAKAVPRPALAPHKMTPLY